MFCLLESLVRKCPLKRFLISVQIGSRIITIHFYNTGILQNVSISFCCIRISDHMGDRGV